MKKVISLLAMLVFSIMSAFAQEVHPNAEKLTANAWAFEGFQNGKEMIVAELPATLSFKNEEGSYLMSAQFRNTLFGPVNSIGKKTIELSDKLGMTMMVSPEGEEQFFNTLKKMTHYKIKKDKLTLSAKGSKEKMVFKIKE